MSGRLLDAVPLSSLTGVGAAQSSKLAKIGLHTVQDLLLHLPLRYEDRTHLYPIAELLPGVYATVEGEVLNSNITFGGRRMMTCQISDGTGILTMRFFNFNAAMKNSLATGRRVLAYGEAKRGKYGAEMIHPEYRVQGDMSTPELQETLTPVYPTTEGIKQATLRKLTDQALELLETCAISELLPPELAQGMMSLPELNIGLVHGRMKPAEKQAVMQAFKQGEMHLLVATTVIEVGVDVPNSSLMIIENPERLGLAQLHQLRGRVGRGAVASHSVLLYKSPLSKTAQKRLQVLRDSNDGFVIAQKDLEIRGPGELLGTRQTGNAEFKVADLLRDQAMIPDVQRIARHIHERYPLQAQALIERWMPETERYSNA